jgi:hypothetical protein
MGAPQYLARNVPGNIKGTSWRFVLRVMRTAFYFQRAAMQHRQHNNMTASRLTTEQREIRNAELVRQRMFGATVRQIAKSSGLSKSRVHQLVYDVAIICGGPRRKPEKPLYCLELVQLQGAGFAIVRRPA